MIVKKEIGELLVKYNLDVVADQKSWRNVETRIDVKGYEWFGKPRITKIVREGREELVFGT